MQLFAFALLALWLGVLFRTMAIVAEEFLSPNLRTIAHTLGMSETLAGVTLFAFGNGSSDLFSTFAAMTSHNGSLAIGELLGAASFIEAVVIGSVAIIHPFSVPRMSFARDVGFFAVAATMTIVFVADGELQAWECGSLVGYYVFYVVFVVSWHWYMSRRQNDTVSLDPESNSCPGDDEMAHETTALLQRDSAWSHQDQLSSTLDDAVHPEDQAITRPDSDAAVGKDKDRDQSGGISSKSSRWKSIWGKFAGGLMLPMCYILLLTIPSWESHPDIIEVEHSTEVFIEDQIRAPEQDAVVAGASTAMSQDGDDMETISLGAVDIPPKSPTIVDPPKSPTIVELPAGSHEECSRMLVCIQLVLGPLFLATLIWANFSNNFNWQDLFRYFLPSIFFSFVCLAVLLRTTSSSLPPNSRGPLCLFGFILSVAWISMIASELVGVLVAFGVILDVSDALLGLTVFAVGNSSNDLIANTSVARRGLPVMAMSASLGGPMLNILLGIGIGGLFTIFKDMPKGSPGFLIPRGSYALDVSATLLISGATLLTVLTGLLFVVPFNNWRMDKRVGWGLIALWSTSIITNVALTLTGTV